jgi:autotransporter strand-loop-strand O-heptosyltransferase
MNPDLVIGHGSFLGHTGYAVHTREFFTALKRIYNVRVNNVSHTENIDYLSQEQKDMLFYQKWNHPPYEIGTPPPNLDDYKDILNIVLHTTGSGLFGLDFPGAKIAYNVWESTRQPDDFFNLLKTYDQLWVPSEWQRTVSIEQGYPHDRIKVVPEGIDPKIFKPRLDYFKDHFIFFVAARWEYRKSMNEIVTQFVSTFRDNQNVKLVISADNPFPSDGMRTTEERINALDLGDYKCKIEIKHFMPFNEYVETLQTCNCYVSCARAEGWNLPLLEAIACGVPTICSDYGAQLDFAKGISHTVDIVRDLPPNELFGWNGPCPGTWAEPDYEHLGYQMKYVFENFIGCRYRAEMGSSEIRRKFTWDVAAKVAAKHIYDLQYKSKDNDIILVDPDSFKINNYFHEGAFLELIGESSKMYRYTIIDRDTNRVEYESMLPTNCWIKSNKKYFVNWRCEIWDDNTLLYEHNFNAKGKKVMISFGSSALGDTLAWMPYIELFRVKHNCAIFVSTFWNDLLSKAYPQFKFVKPGHIESDVYALYSIKVENNDPSVHKQDWREIPLQKVSADILGIEYQEIKPRIQPPITNYTGNKFVTISEASTAGCKQWQYPGGWQEIVDSLKDIGYEVMVVSREQSELQGVINQTNQPLWKTIENIYNSDFFMGVSSGLSWLAWALNKPVFLISGCTMEWNEFQCNRIINKEVCHGCMNNPNHVFDKGDWWWCPEKKDMICTKSITPQMVWIQIMKFLKGQVGN